MFLKRKMKSQIIGILFIIVIVFIWLSWNSTKSNTYFFEEGLNRVMYKGFFVPLSGNEITQDINLNIQLLYEFADGNLYLLRLDKLEVNDPLDQLVEGQKILGYFYVTKESIYRLRLSYNTLISNYENNKIINNIKINKEEYMSNWDIVCNDNGTYDIVDKDGWHNYVEVDEQKRIYHCFNEYIGGTSYYEQIVWELGKGIIYYKSGVGSMLKYIEFGIDLSKYNNET